jgi:hypothetical protein
VAFLMERERLRSEKRRLRLAALVDNFSITNLKARFSGPLFFCP